MIDLEFEEKEKGFVKLSVTVLAAIPFNICLKLIMLFMFNTISLN